jgi:hypothetical protein
MIFSEGTPEFVRIKDLSGVTLADGRLYQEIDNSFLVHRERFPEWIPRHVACIAPPDMSQDLCGMAAEITACEPVLLEAKSMITPSDSAPADQQTLFPFTSAIGAALRSL